MSEVNSTAVVRRRRNLFDRIAPSDTEEPGVEPEKMTEGCALLGCHSRSGRARSSTPVHVRPARQLLVMEFSLY